LSISADWQATFHHNFWGKPVPCSVCSWSFPRRTPLFYNAVFVPMVIAMYYHMFLSETEEGQWSAPSGTTTLNAICLMQGASARAPAVGSLPGRRQLCENISLCCCAAHCVMIACSDQQLSAQSRWNSISRNPLGSGQLVPRLMDARGSRPWKAHPLGRTCHRGLSPVFDDAREIEPGWLPSSSQVRDGGRSPAIRCMPLCPADRSWNAR
jgi:hypothetical protein